MGENFIFWKLSSKHKKWFVIHQLLLFLTIVAMILIAVKVTNPKITDIDDKMSLTVGGMIGFMVMILAFTNRLKSLLKIKFVAFLVIWLLLFSFNKIIDTMIWTVGLSLIPLAIDDMILCPIWKRVWFNNYE
jgi:hypothetical protein